MAEYVCMYCHFGMHERCQDKACTCHYGEPDDTEREQLGQMLQAGAA